MNLEVFQSLQTKRVLSYVAKAYGDEPEFLWKKSPKNCIFRNQRNRKWYAVVLAATSDKLGLDFVKEIEMLNLRFEKGLAREFARGQSAIFPAYHMNKDNWITIILDESLSDEEIFSLLDKSYQIVNCVA